MEQGYNSAKPVENIVKTKVWTILHFAHNLTNIVDFIQTWFSFGGFSRDL